MACGSSRQPKRVGTEGSAGVASGSLDEATHFVVPESIVLC